jgi:outer membrane protein assembly factor BamB
MSRANYPCRSRSIVLCLRLGCWLTLLLALTVTAGEWAAWRGPNGTGISTETNLPIHWSTNENVRWRVPLPERGNSTPVTWGNRIFVTQAITRDQRRTLMCFDRANGKLLWQQGVTYREEEPTHETNPICSASPVTDGERVIAWFGSAGLFCYDLDGKELWKRELGKQRHIWGWGSSPVLHGDLCFLNFGPGEPSFLIALDKKTGKEVWKRVEPNGDTGEKKAGQDKAVWTGSWSCPIVINASGREELILSWPKRVIALDPGSGKELWSCAGLNPLSYSSPLYDEEKGIVVAMGGFMGMSLAVKAGGSGDVTETHRLWHHPKTRQRIGSGVIHAGHVYIVNDPGVAECFELESGKLIWEERLKGPGPKSENWSSLVLANDKLFAINQSGDAFVLRASSRFEMMATNSLGEATLASLAPSNGQIFIRTFQHLWCIGND